MTKTGEFCSKMIKVGYFAFIRELTGKKEENLVLDLTVGDLMNSLCNAYGAKFRDFCMDDERISRNVNILVNGKHIQHLEGDETPLEENDDISIFPLIGGG